MIRTKLEDVYRLYRKETDPKVKERLLLVLRIKSDGEIPAHAAKELHRSKPWASEWLARFAKEGVGGLKNRPKRIKERKTNKTISKDCFSDKKRITRKQARMDYKTGKYMIFRRGRVNYHYTHIYWILHQWGLKQKIPQKIHVNTASREEKEFFKKTVRKY
jgi:putative transposase